MFKIGKPILISKDLLKQNTAKQIREAELKVYENMPSDETAQKKY